MDCCWLLYGICGLLLNVGCWCLLLFVAWCALSVGRHAVVVVCFISCFVVSGVCCVLFVVSC